jgi:hypothetical protein
MAPLARVCKFVLGLFIFGIFASAGDAGNADDVDDPEDGARRKENGESHANGHEGIKDVIMRHECHAGGMLCKCKMMRVVNAHCANAS